MAALPARKLSSAFGVFSIKSLKIRYRGNKKYFLPKLQKICFYNLLLISNL
ncbi:hypothetical protein NEOC65_002412 [Neochlamydia sp. AcF65]|nr:hypothetical protein [Neochlamydia sp. AcF65]MBS4169718.1 hypothetical protein [Neochlamydia sp. AcF95]